MSTYSETLNPSESTAVAQSLPASSWMELNLPWNESFWSSLKDMTLMRLNPHWHIEKENGSGYPVEDILVAGEFQTDVHLEAQARSFRAHFAGIGLTIAARSVDGGENTALSYSFDPPEHCPVSAEQVEQTLQYWLPSLREYYRLYESNSLKHRFWRFFMNRIMLTMNPTQRRICGFMFKLTVLEALLIVILGVGWYFYGG